MGRALGEEILRLAPEGGRALALSGELGSGKTTFTKGLALGLGVLRADQVTSPTFVIKQEYQGRQRIHHYDAYRLAGAGELLSLGFEEDLGRGEVVVVEWADRVLEAIPAEALAVEFEHCQAPNVSGTAPAVSTSRRLTFRGDPSLWESAVLRSVDAARRG